MPAERDAGGGWQQRAAVPQCRRQAKFYPRASPPPADPQAPPAGLDGTPGITADSTPGTDDYHRTFRSNAGERHLRFLPSCNSEPIPASGQMWFAAHVALAEEVPARLGRANPVQLRMPSASP